MANSNPGQPSDWIGSDVPSLYQPVTWKQLPLHADLQRVLYSIGKEIRGSSWGLQRRLANLPLPPV